MYIYIREPEYNKVLQETTPFSWLINGIEGEDDWIHSEPVGAALSAASNNEKLKWFVVLRIHEWALARGKLKE